MTELGLIFVSGLAGSGHCLGMCGPFALLVAAGARGAADNIRRQVAHGLGRIFTYAVAGAAVGFLGQRFIRAAPAYVPTQAILCLLAGVLLMGQGLWSTGLLPRLLRAIGWTPSPRGRLAHAACLATGGARRFLTAPGWRPMFLAGVINGFLPCGLVYAFLALAAASGDFPTGATRMALFGAGTLPAMIGLGLGGGMLGVAARARLAQLAAWCVVATGGWSIARGAIFLFSSSPPDGACPFCG